MTHDEFVDYQLTVSNCVAAVERGMPRAEVRGVVLESTAPLFDGRADARPCGSSARSPAYAARRA